jgi:hypothetical protein
MQIPDMKIPMRMAAFYYRQLRGCCSTPTLMHDLPEDMQGYYKQCRAEAFEVFTHNKRSEPAAEPQR